MDGWTAPTVVVAFYAAVVSTIALVRQIRSDRQRAKGDVHLSVRWLAANDADEVYGSAQPERLSATVRATTAVTVVRAGWAPPRLWRWRRKPTSTWGRLKGHQIPQELRRELPAATSMSLAAPASEVPRRPLVWWVELASGQLARSEVIAPPEHP